MRILITGAYGFLGTQITAFLREQGHDVVCGARNVKEAQRLLATESIMYCDFSTDTTIDIWLPRLKQIDAVINCVGILQARNTADMEKIHFLAPKALFEACYKSGIKKIIHISALGAGLEADTPYAVTKWKLEDFLKQSSMPWVILRPSILYSTGACGGTALFRGLAGLPGFIPLVGMGEQKFQPLSVQDLARAISVALYDANITQVSVDAVGPKVITLKEMLIALRQWLGFSKAIIIPVPLSVMRIGAYLGNIFHDIPINSTAFKMLQFSNTADTNHFIDTFKFTPKSLQNFLQEHPSSMQDRWHARLFFLKPLLRIITGMVWVLAGAAPLLLQTYQAIPLFDITKINTPLSTEPFVLVHTLLIVLGLWMLSAIKLRLVACLQILMVAIYTIISCIFSSMPWLYQCLLLLNSMFIIMPNLIIIAIEENR